MHHLSVTTTCAAPESFARGGPTLTTFFSFMGEEFSKYHYKRAIFGPPAKRHLNGDLLACRLWPKIESWLGSFKILRGSGPVLLKTYIFVILEGVRTPCPPPPSGSANALHPPMSKSRANVFLIFQCPGICLTPSQVDILVSDDSHAFCPTMYNIDFTWVEIRAKSELRMGLVPLNMLKLSSFSFY